MNITNAFRRIMEQLTEGPLRNQKNGATPTSRHEREAIKARAALLQEQVRKQLGGGKVAS